MSEKYKALRSATLKPGMGYCRLSEELPKNLTPDSPAIQVMTDLKRATAFTVEPDVSVDAALQKMIYCGVRLLLVAGSDGAVIGIVTARDIMGEQPVHVASSERIARDKVIVEQIMTTQNNVDVLNMEDVMNASVGDIIVTLREAGHQHALVVDTGQTTGKQIIRGIFSTTQIGRQLGVEIQPTGIKQSFAELEAVLIR
jgi:CBS domain-containing protein